MPGCHGSRAKGHTLSPCLTAFTLAPTSTTMPDTSEPGMKGSGGLSWYRPCGQGQLIRPPVICKDGAQCFLRCGCSSVIYICLSQESLRLHSAGPAWMRLCWPHALGGGHAENRP